MNRGSTLFLQAVIWIIGIAALALCIFWLPGLASSYAAEHPEIAHLRTPFLVYAYISFSPFFVALYQTLKLLNHIERNLAFSELSVKALRNIKYCAICIICWLALGEIYVIFGLKVDRALFAALGILLTFATSVIATFAAVLQKLIQNAVDIKSENDLTV